MNHLRSSLATTCLRWSATKAGSAFRRDRQAFSLIEVVFALAVFSFSILVIVGLMAAGLSSASDSSSSLAIANIQRVVRANLNATAYTNILNEVGTKSYFTVSGFPTTNSPASPVDAPYYDVSYTAANPAASLITSSSVEVVMIRVLSPYPVNAHTNIFTLFIAQ
jgi:uncharacterized protein (TIGR02598 family)